ncbi:Dolichol phosphate glucosyltransferase, related [Neospora caninum Liverpool]|uniref:Dolichol phosphate glucosyltransferase, related n=1 Tax=Neospora caninum (strain Liverpool) TaxID=572307 RepID=F0VPA0_NEOCL|nr:Dolichol phosphate glucosyltransferase, related [Neospora caninum Liverpool]CBZ55546.1 Dolichol phosphate glucosyltransferase, related [Neospora caninum Liverpool]CEL70286.1 TPA: Dolichol phosphate glucosyltransferase, related [Neospora caninum Liverpool]|eukprot:XP_003885574.1 Dolichol phosphate glucosyltransferase, related [Neospora caninum Liverpool]
METPAELLLQELAHRLGVSLSKASPLLSPILALVLLLLAACFTWFLVRFLLWILDPVIQWQVDAGKPASCFLLPSADACPGSQSPSWEALASDVSPSSGDALSLPPSVDLSVIVPAFNEALRLPLAVSELLSFLEARRASLSSSSRSGVSDRWPVFTYEIIVVDDGSTDGTAAIAPLLGAAIFSPSTSPPASLSARAAAAAAQAASRAFAKVHAPNSRPASKAPTACPRSSPLSALGASSSPSSCPSLSCPSLSCPSLSCPSRSCASSASPDAGQAGFPPFAFSPSDSVPVSAVAAEAMRAATKVHLDAGQRLRDCFSPLVSRVGDRGAAPDTGAERHRKGESEREEESGESGERGEKEGETPASSPLSSLRVLRLKENRGKGFAVKIGAKHARGRMLLMADADGATTVESLVLLERALLERKRLPRGRSENVSRSSSLAHEENADAAQLEDKTRQGEEEKKLRAGVSEAKRRENRQGAVDAGEHALETDTAGGRKIAQDGRESDGDEETTLQTRLASLPPLAFPWPLLYRRGDREGSQEDTEALVAFGSRRQLEQAAISSRSWHRNFLMHAFHWCVRSVVGDSHIKDTQCGFKLFTRFAARQLFPRLHLCRWAFDVELLLLSRLLRVPVAEIPVEWEEKEGSKLNVLGASFQMARDILVLKCMYTAGIWKASADSG